MPAGGPVRFALTVERAECGGEETTHPARLGSMPSSDASAAAAATVPRPVDVDRIHECVKRLGLRY